MFGRRLRRARGRLLQWRVRHPAETILKRAGPHRPRADATCSCRHSITAPPHRLGISRKLRAAWAVAVRRGPCTGYTHSGRIDGRLPSCVVRSTSAAPARRRARGHRRSAAEFAALTSLALDSSAVVDSQRRSGSRFASRTWLRTRSRLGPSESARFGAERLCDYVGIRAKRRAQLGAV